MDLTETEIDKDVRRYMINNRKHITENIDFKVADSITGLITNNKIKSRFPPFLRPYIYEDHQRQTYCIKMVIKYIKINHDYIDKLMQKKYIESEDELKAMECNRNTNDNQVPDAFDMKIIIAAYQDHYSDIHMHKIKSFMNRVKIHSIDHINYATFSIDVGDHENVMDNMSQ